MQTIIYLLKTNTKQQTIYFSTNLAKNKPNFNSLYLLKYW